MRRNLKKREIAATAMRRNLKKRGIAATAMLRNLKKMGIAATAMRRNLKKMGIAATAMRRNLKKGGIAATAMRRNLKKGGIAATAMRRDGSKNYSPLPRRCRSVMLKIINAAAPPPPQRERRGGGSAAMDISGSRAVEVDLFDYFGYKGLYSHCMTSREFNFSNGILSKVSLSLDITYSFLRYSNFVIFQNSSNLWLRTFLSQKTQNTSFENIIDLFSRHYFAYEINISRGGTFNCIASYQHWQVISFFLSRQACMTFSN